MSNNSKTWFFLTALSLAFILTGHFVADRQGLLVGFLLALSINLLVYFHSEQRILRSFKYKQLEGRDPWGILQSTEELAKKARIPTPRVFLLESPTPTSLALGRSWTNGSILLSKGLLDRFSEEELRAILAHEIIGIRRLDTLSFGVGSAFAESIFQVLYSLDRLISVGNKNKKNQQVQIFQTLFSPLAALFVHGSVSRKGYLEADRQAARLIESPDLMATVLWKLRSYSQTIPMKADPWTAHLFIVNPLKPDGLNKYFQPQPPIERRVQSLVGRYPI